ncbi:hypothetical protein M3Y99_01349700 [Aphelenchoides fujianensis]|nr:hypothetical protein M3Y99_01349700 [Aphelenchoides fujianensis]
MSEPTVHRWKIPNFAARFVPLISKDKWTSGEFEVNGMKGLKFCLFFFPKGNHNDLPNHSMVGLKLRDLKGRSSVHIRDEIWIEAADGGFHFKKAYERTIEGPYGGRWSKFALQFELLELAEQGPFFICCKIQPIVPLDEPKDSMDTLLLFARKNFDELVQQPDWTADFMKENSEIAFQVTVAPSS